jgi:UDP-3-O-[3-hydroxymyristoyl] glucosamine N-acyltransferase
MIRELGLLGEIAELTGGRVIGDANLRIVSIASIDDADSATLTYATDERYLQAALASRAGAILAAASAIDPAATYANRSSRSHRRGLHSRRFSRHSRRRA